MRRSGVCLLVLAGGLASVGMMVACDQDRDATAGAGATGGETSATTGVGGALATPAATTTGVGGSGGGGVDQIPPAGWVAWEGWSEDCPLHYPPTPDLLPKPIAWAPCTTAPAGVECRAMVTDWTTSGSTMSLFPRFANWNGTPHLLFRRFNADYHLELVAEIDGVVKNAIMRVKAPGETGSNFGCVTGLQDLGEGRWALNARGHDSLGDYALSPHRGGIGGTVGVLQPELLAHNTDSIAYTFRVSADWLMRVGAPGSVVNVTPWSLSPDTYVVSPPDDPENFKGGQFEVVGDAVFWSTGTLFAHGINLWTPAGGVQIFERYPGDYTRGATDFGTDGVDMVWARGEGKDPAEYQYPTRDLMTAPFTTDPQTMQPRRVRSVVRPTIGTEQWVVGCGYAAHHGGNNDHMVVRLSDGVSWTIPMIFPDFNAYKAIGLTCDEVFLLGRYDGRDTIVRIRIDSLGPGAPAD